VDSDEAKQARFDAERARILRALGANLRELRGASRTQEAVADRANLHPTYIGNLERGEREPGLLALLILAEAFEVPLDRLVRGIPVPKERKLPPGAKRVASGG
jgi:transcriptional regulator with XRE-family HTH domain